MDLDILQGGMIFKRLLVSVLFGMTIFLAGCKKTTYVQEQLEIRDFAIKTVTVDFFSVKYSIKNFGYIETGIEYAPIDDSTNIHVAKGVRDSGVFNAIANNVYQNTTYRCRAYAVDSEGKRYYSNEQTVKTPDAGFPRYIEELPNKFFSDADGNYTMEVKVERVNELNLLYLDFNIDNEIQEYSGPVQNVNNPDWYTFTLKGKVKDPYSNTHSLQLVYKKKNVFWTLINFLPK